MDIEAAILMMRDETCDERGEAAQAVFGWVADFGWIPPDETDDGLLEESYRLIRLLG